MTDDNGIVVYQQQNSLMPVMALADIQKAYGVKHEFVKSILREGVDFGAIPGTDKKTLLKPGAEKMTSFFGLSPEFLDVQTVEDWTGSNHNGEPFFYYRIKCVLFHGDQRIASADGSCNSWEKKYRYRKSGRKCPKCGAEAIIKGKEEYGGGWLCFKNKGGCGAKFANGDKLIESQDVGQIANPDVAESVNTILKMAQKRALVAATLIATGTSEYFTQDMEDFADEDYHVPTTPRPESKPTVHTPPTTPTPLIDAVKASADAIPAEVVDQVQEKPTRPFTPEHLRELLYKKAATYNGVVEVSPQQIGLLASMLELPFAGNADADKIRHSCIKYMFGKDSLKDLDGTVVKALLDWLKPVKADNGSGEYVIDEMAKKELLSIWPESLKDAGQQEMDL